MRKKYPSQCQTCKLLNREVPEFICKVYPDPKHEIPNEIWNYPLTGIAVSELKQGKKCEHCIPMTEKEV